MYTCVASSLPSRDLLDLETEYEKYFKDMAGTRSRQHVNQENTLCLYKAGYDFKRLFTISEYYDRDRPAFYKAIQSVRNNGMDMTGWLDYFITGLETQMIEVKERGEQVIRRDVLVQKHGLNERQAKVLDVLMKKSSVHISEIEELCSGVTRRTLQRDMNGLMELNLIRITGSARQSNYEFIR